MMAVKGTIKPLHDKVLVADMNFGEQRSSGGIVMLGDDGKDHGIHPRWARVYAVGPEHKEDYNVGDWVLVEHGRWSRGIEVEDNGNKITIRLIDNNCVMLWDKEQPDTTVFGFIDTVSKPSLSDFGKVL
jgi:co-chaperonin GroES (HSP10)